ncbi:protein BREAST CANCER SUSCEPTIBILITY 2 homolog B isoform X1 [Herrania umbratica]|uniref:Protein BREAST CANCER SUSCEPTIBILITY 2 homolog B isoform X1 n=1 Tax=Herrania umbratica TaxID=108875 RepID=A0A6J1AQ35_9ROSI|nr:protein BREAST CANCER SUSCEPTIBILITY 2 homolog B isoform X1 [Herrania umbratica]XP_021288996.1 protein BREAST CANCER SUSCEPTIBILITY 2 homolog B isoform X1 [Herrania umbratica]
MTTWQIFSEAGNDFRWEVSGRILPSKPDDEPNRAPVPPLPSRADLLLQGCSKLIENGDAGVGKCPMFRTGLGKSVALKESSIAKALSILGDDDGDTTVSASEVVPRNNGFGCSNSLFQTGSGKMVNISSAGLVRAKTLLGPEQDNEHHSFEGFQHPKKLPATNEPCWWQSFSHSEKKEGLRNTGVADIFAESRQLLNSRNGSLVSTVGSENDSTPVHSKEFDSAPKPPPIKFHTAGGRSLSVSSDALKRARSLLGDPELGNFFGEVEEEVSPFTVPKEKFNDASSNKENHFFTSFSLQGTIKSKDTSKDFISPLKASFKQMRPIFNSEKICCGTNLIDKFDAVGNSSACVSTTNMPSAQKSLNNSTSEKNLVTNISLPRLGKSFGGPLVDISNNFVTSQTNNKRLMTEKKRIGRSSFISPYKRPRCSEFSAPLNKDVSFVGNALSTSSDDHSYCKRTISTKYPFQVPRVYMKEYFAVPPSACSMLECLSDQEKQIKPENAVKYMFKDESGLRSIGAEAFYDMLAHSGASVQYISKEWVANHYKWIVWKLVCYERRYPSKCAGKFLTISNVLEELKYRYDREVNHAHRSAIKRILEGDASPSTMLVLCISNIQSNSEPKMETNLVITNGADNSGNAKVELTDGWYSMDAVLDVLLSKQLAAGKLFVGQKLRIWGAGLCGWVGPVSPLEASSAISLLLNINGTFRAHWADRLGFCKGVGIPLAFRCIKSDGGPVPWTLVGVTRIYPVLYRERLSNGGSIVRSERMENRMLQQHNQRCLVVVDHVISEYQRGVNSSHILNDIESEGAKILKILETAAEPEVLMAEMSPEQLTSFATYKSKLEATRQLEMEKSIEKALAEAGLNERDVVPFIRVRVVGLTTRKYHGKGRPKEGIITIWNPTEKQKSELVEGQAYVVAGLIPMNSDSEALYLQARGFTSKWQPLSPMATECFEPFFSQRKSTKLSNLGEIPLSSEFDIAVYVVYVGEVYTAAHQKKQWVFVTDDSISNLPSEGLSDSLLAISFCSSCIDKDSFAPINSNLVGSMVGFCNLIKKAKDQMNHLWVAEATENSAYFLNLNPSICSHLRIAGASVQTWAKASNSIIGKLREKVLFILDNRGG